MNEPVFENSMFTADKDLHSERDNLLQMGALADYIELKYTENRFILNKFPSCCDGFFYILSEK